MSKPHSNFSIIKIKDKRYITLYYRNHHFRTGFNINNETDFDKKNQKFNLKWRKENQGAEDSILNFKLKIDTLIRNARQEGLDELVFIKTTLAEEKNEFKKTKISNSVKPSEIFKEFIKEVIVKEVKKENSKQRFSSHFNKIVWFEESQKDTTSLDEIDMDYIYRFIRWMAKEKVYTQVVTEDKQWGRSFTAKKTVKNTNSTIKRWLSDFNRFLLWCSTNNKKLNFPHKEIIKLATSLKSSADNQEIIAMTKGQWEAFKNFKLPQKLIGLQNTYDAYAFSATTGLRASDLRKMHSVHVVNERTISMLTTKTSHKFNVRMNDTAFAIYNKYNQDFREKFPTIQRLSINLRKILKEIPEFQFNDIKYEYILENVTEIPVKNYEKFSHHSSRRTFITNCIRNGAKLSHIQRFTGWQDLKQLKNYLDYVNADDNEDAILNF